MTTPRPWWRRMFALENVAAVALGVAVFLVLVPVWNSALGAIGAAAVASLVTALTWLAWASLRRPPDIETVLDSPKVGSIPPHPDTPAPVLTDPDSTAAGAYGAAAGELEALTTGQVVLVASPAPGQGATTIAMNLAMSATRTGRRVVLIDGDPVTQGLSRFHRTGAAPGLTNLADGSTDLAAAARMWAIDETSRLPVIPAGSPVADVAAAAASDQMADLVDTLTDVADLVLIDTAPIQWDGAARPLATHADGTLLVLSPGAEEDDVTSSAEALREAGAPILGFVVNRTGTATPASPLLRTLKRALATFLIVVSVFSAWNLVQIWDSWRTVGRDRLDVAGAADLLPLPIGGISLPPELDAETSSIVTSAPRTERDEFTTFLVVGSDIGGERADVIMFVLLPRDGSAPVMASIPRDLYVPNRCTQGYTKINANLVGCGEDVNGPTLLALAVEDFTGIEVDHFALFDFDGFERIIDALGGIEICVDHAVRDPKSFLDLPAGCTIADGEQALAWVRSRRTQELVDGRWRTMEGVNDLTRNERQQDLVLALFDKMSDFSSPSDLTRTVRSLSDAFTLDDRLGVGDAISLAWELRSLDPAEVERISIPVVDHLTPEGAAVLVPTMSFDELLSGAYPEGAAT